MNTSSIPGAMDTTNNELSCLCLVVRAQPYSDKDLIFSLLSQKSGKISAIAKSAKGSKKFSSGIPDILDLGTFDLRLGRGSLYQVVHFKPQQAFKKIRSHLHSYVAACCWIESLDLLTLDAHQDSHELFEIALSVLQLIDESSQPRISMKTLCEGLEIALLKTGFGSEHTNAPAGFKKMHALVRRIEEISGRELKSWNAVTEIVQNLEKEN